MTNFFEGLTKEQIIILKKQIEIFERLKTQSRQQIIPKNQPILPEGTLIHETGFNEQKLHSIANSGIITGQYFGIDEDGETYFCADFHRVSEETTLEDYNNNFSHVDGRCPLGTRGKKTIAFIIHPNKELEEIAKYDCYRERTEESKHTKSFVNEKGLPIKDKNKGSSILFGVPSRFINGIIIGDDLIKEEKINFLKHLFPNCYLVRNNGKLIYKQTDNEEMTNLRIESIQEAINKEKAKKEIEFLNDRIKNDQNKEERLWKAISELPIEEIAKIYELIGWQGNTLEIAMRTKKEKNKGEKRK